MAVGETQGEAAVGNKEAEASFLELRSGLEAGELRAAEPDGSALASSVNGMDHMVRTFIELTGRPLWEVVRMASLTPARIAGRDREIGSLDSGKRADIVVLDKDLNVKRVFIDGKEVKLDE